MNDASIGEGFTDGLKLPIAIDTIEFAHHQGAHSLAVLLRGHIVLRKDATGCTLRHSLKHADMSIRNTRKVAAVLVVVVNIEEENDAYTKPMLYLTPLQFPDLAREQILRLMIDILFILEKKEDMYKIINSLKNKNYKNVKDKIKRS